MRLTSALSIMRIAIFAVLSSAALAPAHAAVAAQHDRPLVRAPKYFTPDTLKDHFDAAIVDASAPNADVIVQAFAAKNIPVVAVDPSSELLADSVGSFLASLKATTGNAATSTTPSTSSTPPKDPANAPPLSELDYKALQEVGKSLELKVSGVKRDDLEAAITAKRAEIAAATSQTS